MESDASPESSQRLARRSWLFGGRPPSNASVGLGALLYGAVASWWSSPDAFTDLPRMWQESPSQVIVFLLALTTICSLSVYTMLRVGLPLTRPRVTKRWRSEPLVMRTASLAQSIIMFRTLEAVPAFSVGLGLGMLLTATAGQAGIPLGTDPAVLLCTAVVMLGAGLAGAIGKCQAERSAYKTFLLDGWTRKGAT